MHKKYVHGYDLKENKRLRDQAEALAELLHTDTVYERGSLVLEAGCGVGAQTVTLARNSPHASFISIDISGESIAKAKIAVDDAGLGNVQFRQVDIFDLDFDPGFFDHVFVCHLLEHLDRPDKALVILKDLIKTGGTITVIEGDHGSAYFYPDSKAAHQAIQCLVDLQSHSGGNARIGRELYPLLSETGFSSIHVTPRMVYVDSSKPGLVEGFTKNTFTAMIEGVRDTALKARMIDAVTFDRGIRDLYRTTEDDGVFCYTFFKAVATKHK
jgi:ubiquinone/menaquinone biosynthesis C-methylase UbiE